MTVAPQSTVIKGNHIALTLDADGTDIDATVDGHVYPPMPFSTNQKLILHGNGGSDDSISIDARLLTGSGNTVDDPNGAVALKVVGASTADTVDIDGTNDFITYNSARIDFANASSLEYFDGVGGGDNITCSGPIPIIIDSDGGDTITDNGADVTLNFY